MDLGLSIELIFALVIAVLSTLTIIFYHENRNVLITGIVTIAVVLVKSIVSLIMFNLTQKKHEEKLRELNAENQRNMAALIEDMQRQLREEMQRQEAKYECQLQEMRRQNERIYQAGQSNANALNVRLMNIETGR